MKRILLTIVSVLLGSSLPSASASERVYTFKRGVNISHWLSQNNAERPYAAPWFGEADVAWIAAHGFDHIRYPIDGREWLKPDGSLDDAKIAPFEAALAWTRERGLGAILDMHFLPGASFAPGEEESRVFEDEALAERVADLWRRVARRFAGEGPWLRFEILNEPVAKENAQLNPFNRRMLAAIRESNPTRIVYITSNRWSTFKTVQDLEVPDDPNVAITLHYYEPHIFTHQRASWSDFSDDMPPIDFPGRVPDVAPYMLAGHWALKYSGTRLTIEELERDFETVAAWARTHAPGCEIHLGEFGVYRPAPVASKRNWIAAVRAACERRGWGWAVWDYRGGFAVRDEEGGPTTVLEALFK